MNGFNLNPRILNTGVVVFYASASRPGWQRSTYESRFLAPQYDLRSIIDPPQSICPYLLSDSLALLFIPPSTLRCSWFDCWESFCLVESGPVGFDSLDRVDEGVLSY
jgi:hypothetical protein